MTGGSAAVELARLSRRADEAKERYLQARDEARRAWEKGHDALEPLVRYHAQVAHRQREPDQEEKHRLTLALLNRIKREGLDLEPLDVSRPAAGVRVVDPRPVHALEEAARVSWEASRARDLFAAQHGQELRNHENRKRMERIREALGSNDPELLQLALCALQDRGAGPLTTDDLPMSS